MHSMSPFDALGPFVEPVLWLCSARFRSARRNHWAALGRRAMIGDLVVWLAAWLLVIASAAITLAEGGSAGLRA